MVVFFPFFLLTVKTKRVTTFQNNSPKTACSCFLEHVATWSECNQNATDWKFRRTSIDSSSLPRQYGEVRNRSVSVWRPRCVAVWRPQLHSRALGAILIPVCTSLVVCLGLGMCAVLNFCMRDCECVWARARARARVWTSARNYQEMRLINCEIHLSHSQLSNPCDESIAVSAISRLWFRSVCGLSIKY